MEFSRYNNQAFGYERFEYLYLEDTLADAERIRQTHEKICGFFEGVSIQKQPYSAVYGEHILFLILELLKLYDRRKDTTILDIVIQLLDFLSEKDASQVDLYQINRLQTEKRRRKLNPEEIQYLSSMKSKGIPAQYQLATNILLESFYEAQLIYDQLCPEEKEVFASYPIINLWKSKG